MSQHFRYFTLLTALLAVVVSADFTNAKEGSGQKAGSATKTGSATKQGSATKTDSVALFNGQNLDNWVKRGGVATYAIEGDAIVGTSTPNTPNTFLCTNRDYADFILELELKVDDGLNSGIQIRSHTRKEAGSVKIAKVQGGDEFYTVKYDIGRVFGYQVEIDPSPRAYSGGIYDESRRGWLNDLSGDKNKAAREAFKNGEWNTYRIEAIGNSIKTWVNGVPAADLIDDVDASGFIALQVHGIGDHPELAGTQVRWRNIVITEVTK